MKMILINNENVMCHVIMKIIINNEIMKIIAGIMVVAK
jgi:hypothetical protein